MVKTFAEAAASVGKAALLLALPVYVVVDVIRSSVSDAYVERRVDLCASGRELPPSILGKMDVFLQCATVTEASFGGFTLAQVEQVRDAAFASGVEAGTEEFEMALLEEALTGDMGGFQSFIPPLEPLVIEQDGAGSDLSVDEFVEPSPIIELAPILELSAFRRSLEGVQDTARGAALGAIDSRAPSLDAFGMGESR